MTAPGRADRVTLDALLVHRAWVRALARRLVADPGRADDVEQETWRRAIERPPAHEGALRAWLSAVTRNVARGLGRAESRRARRDSFAPSPRSAPRPDDVVAEAEVQHRLVAEVLALEEPYRSAVLQRYFEGLSAREIAARQGVPVATVRTRVQRAVERLRERMDVRLGDDRNAWCLLLLGARAAPGREPGAPPARSSTTASAAAAGGGLAMAVGMKSVAAAATIAAAGIAWWLWPRGESPPPRGPVSAPAPSGGAAPAARHGAGGGSERPRESPDRPPADAGPASTASPLVVEVRTLRDEPIAGAAIELRRRTVGEDETRRPPDVRGSTDSSGRSVFRGLRPGDWSIVASTDASAAANTIAQVFDPGPEQRAILYLEPGHEVRGTVRDLRGAPLAGAVVTGSGRRAVCDGSGGYLLARLPSGEVVLRAGRAGQVATPAGVVAVPDVATFDLVLVDHDAVTVTGIVADDATGAPIEGVVVGNSVQPAEAPPPCVTDADGRFRLPGVLRDTLALITLRKPGYRTYPAARPATAPPPGDVVDVGVLRMRHGATIEGTVSSPDGPIEGAEVNLTSPSRLTGSSRSTALTDAAGRFTFASVEAGASQLVANAPGFIARNPAAGGVPLMVGSRSLDVPDDGTVRVDFAFARGGIVTGRVVDADGNAAPGVHVLGGGLSARADGQGAFRLAGLVPGPGVRIWTMAGGFASAEELVDVGDQPVIGLVLRVARTAIVKGRLVAHDGRAIEDARVFVVAARTRGRRDPSRLAGDDDAAGPVPVRDDGTFEAQVPSTAVEAFSVVAWTSSHAPARLDPVALVKGQTEYRVEVPLVAGVTLRGRVLADGRGAAGAAITVGEAGYGYGTPPVRAVTDASGAFAIGRLPSSGAGKVLVTASLSGWVDAEADAVEGSSVELVLERPLEIAGVVETRDRAPVAGVYVAARAVDAAAATARTIPRTCFAFTDADGRFRVQGLRPGRYQLVATRTRGPSPIGEVVVAGTTGLRLVIE